MNIARLLKFSLLGLALVAGLGLNRAMAADETKTITGEASCAKMDLKLQDTCQTVIRVADGAKTVDYYVVGTNLMATGLHRTVCGKPQKVTATGKVAVVNGRLELTPTRIDFSRARESNPRPSE